MDVTDKVQVKREVKKEVWAPILLKEGSLFSFMATEKRRICMWQNLTKTSRRPHEDLTKIAKERVKCHDRTESRKRRNGSFRHSLSVAWEVEVQNFLTTDSLLGYFLFECLAFSRFVRHPKKVSFSSKPSFRPFFDSLDLSSPFTESDSSQLLISFYKSLDSLGSLDCLDGWFVLLLYFWLKEHRSSWLTWEDSTISPGDVVLLPQ